MSHNIQGNPANITTPLVRSVAGTSSGALGAVRIQTTAPHFFATNDVVNGAGIGGTVEANVRTSISVIDATHFDMIDTTFVHAWTSGGTVTDLSLTPYVQVPDDGEPGVVEAINSAIQNLLDRTAYLQEQSNNRLGYQTITVTPAVYNVSNAVNWVVGVDWTGSSVGAYLAKGTTTDDTAVIFDITPYLITQDNRKIDYIRAFFRVAQSHGSLPLDPPEIFAFRSANFQTIDGTPQTADSPLRAAGAVPFPLPATGALYYASGNVQSWDYKCDQDNIVDVSSYRYYIAIIDEHGSGSLGLNTYLGFQLGMI